MLKRKFSITKAIEIIIRSISASIPGAATIASLKENIDNELEFDSINKFANVLADELADLGTYAEEIKLDVEMLKKIALTINSNKDVEKSKYFANLLINCSTNFSDQSRFVKLHTIKLLSNLQVEHLIFLRILFENTELTFEEFVAKINITLDSRFERDLIMLIISDLENYGLIHVIPTRVVNRILKFSSSDWQQKWRMSNYKLSQFGQTFLNNIMSSKKRGESGLYGKKIIE